MVAKTDRGRIRESNQDAYFVGEMPDGTAFAVVCDGMGGAAGGNIASSLAVQVISSKINASYHPNMRDSSICNMLESALSAANVEVYDLAREKADLRGMGTTVVCAVIRGGQAFIAHAGDSRAYLFSADGLQQVTTDHSMVQDLLESGKITPAQKGWAKDYALKSPEGFKSFLEKAPQVVPMSEIAGGEALALKGKKPDEATMLICKQLGVSAEDLEKYGMKEE